MRVVKAPHGLVPASAPAAFDGGRGDRGRRDVTRGREQLDDLPLGVPAPLNLGAKLLDADLASGDRLDRFAAVLWDAAPLANGLGTHGRFADGGKRGGEGGLAVEQRDGGLKGLLGGSHRLDLGKVEHYGKAALSESQQGKPYLPSDKLPRMGRITPKLDAEAFAQRLNQVLDTAKGAPPDKRGAWLGRLFGVSKMTASGWLAGAYMPEPAKVLAMCDRWKVPFMWLYFGRGDMNEAIALTRGEEIEPKSLSTRLDALTMALGVAAELLDGEQPTEAQHARYVALCWGLIEQGMDRADVLVFAKRAMGLLTGGNDVPTGNHRRT